MNTLIHLRHYELNIYLYSNLLKEKLKKLFEKKEVIYRISGKQRFCFNNASLKSSLTKLSKYVVGFIYNDNQLLEHAWMEMNDIIVETTLKNDGDKRDNYIPYIKIDSSNIANEINSHHSPYLTDKFIMPRDIILKEISNYDFHDLLLINKQGPNRIIKNNILDKYYHGRSLLMPAID